MKKKSTRMPEQMDWPTYAHIQSLIKARKSVLEREYISALDFIPPSKFNARKPSGLDKAYKIFSDQYAELRKMEDQLHTTVAAAYKQHPSKEMRDFWGLPE